MAGTTHRRVLCHIALLVAVVAAGLPAIGASAAQIKVSGSLAPGDEVLSFQVSPDGQHIVFAVGQTSDPSSGILSLQSVPIHGGAVRTLALVTPPDYISLYQITPDSSRVVYIGPDAERSGSAVYLVPISGPLTQATKLSNQDGMPWVNRLAISPDSRWVVYDADDRSHRSELYSVPISGPIGAPIKLHSASIQSRVFGFQVTPDSQTIVYTDFTMGWTKLYRVPIAGPATASAELTASAEGSVFNYAITPDSRWVIYSASWISAPMRIYRVRTSGRDASAGPISRSFQPTGDLVLTPDGSRVVFTAREATGQPLDVCQVVIAYPAYVGRVGASPDAFRVVGQFTATADGSQVFYLADHDVAGTMELYRGTLTGPPVKWNRPLIAGGDVVSFWLDESGAIVYLADQDTDGTFELYSVLPDAPLPAIKVSGALVAGGSVWEFRANPIRRRVVYLADQEKLDEAELYSVFMEGGTAGGGPSLLKLSGPLAGGGRVLSFGLTPNGQYVVYRARQDDAQTTELYVADYGPFGVSFDTDALTVPEGTGVVNVPVRLGEASFGPASVDYVARATPDGGASNADFGPVSGTLHFAPGETEKTVAIAIQDDDMREGQEAFEVALSNAVGAYLSFPFRLAVSIADNDQPPPGGYAVYLPLAVR